MAAAPARTKSALVLRARDGARPDPSPQARRLKRSPSFSGEKLVRSFSNENDLDDGGALQTGASDPEAPPPPPPPPHPAPPPTHPTTTT
eukprot:SAG22_NODE_8131_length_680_cov_1.208262_1_plen_88_part_10